MGSSTWGLSGDLVTFVDEAAAATVSGDGRAGSEDRRRGGGSGRLLAQRAVWPVAVVVGLEVLVEEAVELPLVPD